MRKWASQVALATAVIYLALAFSAATCLFTHESHSRASHHHTSGVTHSSLCAWACQANQTSALPATPTQVQALHLVALILLIGATVPSLLSQQSAQSRAPPRS